LVWITRKSKKSGKQIMREGIRAERNKREPAHRTAAAGHPAAAAGEGGKGEGHIKSGR
jgi:hypothetical protein